MIKLEDTNHPVTGRRQLSSYLLIRNGIGACRAYEMEKNDETLKLQQMHCLKMMTTESIKCKNCLGRENCGFGKSQMNQKGTEPVEER
jgi:hypothetical protein